MGKICDCILISDINKNSYYYLYEIMKTHSGKYKIKNRKKYKGDADNVVYRSGWELYAFTWCDKMDHILEWSSEEVVIPYFYDVDKRYHRYFMDLKIKTVEGVTLVEIKPAVQTMPPKFSGKKTKRYINEGMSYVKNMNKWKAAESFAKDRGWKFQIWTEKELTALGIMPKQLKKLKPLPKMKRL
jgi:hypothetical protein|tara:strand:- start:3750 stop:4304 length:555 start_codon:yes stop_codon:yes gene_type:complete